MKTALFGGTFDPVHLFHTGMADFLLSSGRAERVLFLPAPVPPHKAGVRPISPYPVRRAMLELALRPGMEICDIERDRPGKSYTIDTLREFSKRNPGSDFYWVIGSDSLRELHLWHDARTLVRDFDFLTYPRGGETIPDERELSLHWDSASVRKLLDSVVYDAPRFGGSSTEIRAAVHAGKTDSIRSFLNPAVLRFIEKNNLYHGE